jgi:hypothetical protein
MIYSDGQGKKRKNTNAVSKGKGKWQHRSSSVKIVGLQTRQWRVSASIVQPPFHLDIQLDLCQSKRNSVVVIN